MRFVSATPIVPLILLSLLAAPLGAGPDRGAGPTAAADVSLHRGLHADAPGPGDHAEPPGLQDRLLDRADARREAAQAAASAVSAASAPAARGRGLGPRAADALDVSALNGHIDVDYMRDVTEAVVGFGDTSDSGWRPGGSPANEAAAEWIRQEMQAVGLRGVRKMPVPIDRWVFNGASVAVDGGPSFPASSWGGVPGTPPGGIHAEVLDLGLGTAADYDALGQDVTGKIVLVNWGFGDWWVNRHGHQATLEGAAAVIFYTGTTAAGAFYNKRDDSLFAFDATYDDDWVPFVFITRNAANDLRARIAAAPTFVTLTADIELTRAEDGGIGHNVLGMIPGTDRADEVILFTGHHDAWFFGAADDATAIAAMLGIAKAVRDSGYLPRRTLVFLASTNEEYGYTDSYYEWLVGAWYAVTHQRPEWKHRGVFALDFELLGTGDPGERLLIRTHSELIDLASEKLAGNPALTPFGTALTNTVWANADHFTLTAAGIPGMYFNTLGINYLTMNYHTDHDTVSRLNFDYLGQNVAVVNDIWVTVDRADLPILDFVAKAIEAESRLAFVVDGLGLGDLPGVDAAARAGLAAAVADFRAAAEALEAAAPGTPRPKTRLVSRLMNEAEKTLLTELVALDVFDQYIFPHQQLQRDATRMHLAIENLQAGAPAAGLDFVRRTGLTNAGRRFAYQAFVAELARHDPDFDRLQWGGQAHLAPYVDVWQEYHSIRAKVDGGLTDPAEYAGEIASLEAKLAPQIERLNGRLASMADSFRRATAPLVRAERIARGR